MKKLSFAIDNAELIDENPRSSFAVLSLDFFASGKNRHDTFVREDVLRKTAKTIYNCPVLWKYDSSFDDAGTHAPDQNPCGFVPFGTEIKEKTTPDGRVMLNTMAYVWKKYSGRLLEIFSRDKSKAVSVEMSVLDAKEMGNGVVSLEDYMFEGITVLGSFVTPAVPDAISSVVKFSIEKETEEYKQAYLAEFANKYDELDFKIPKKVKENAQEGLDLYKKHGRGGTSVNLSLARYLLKNESSPPEKIRSIAKYFYRHVGDDFEDKAGNKWITWQLWGGNDGLSWSKRLVESMDKIDERKLSYFGQEGEKTMPYEKIEEVNPALKGIEPPISLGQANAIARQADAIGSDDKKNGWAIAISSFKKTHTIKDGKWVEKLKEENMADEEKKPEEMAAVIPEEGKQMPEVMAEGAPAEGSKEEEKTETPEEEKKEDAKEEKKFSFAEFANLVAYMDEETGDDETAKMCKMAAEELKKPEAKFEAVVYGMYAKMCKMSEKMAQMSVEMSALKEFKAGVEAQQKQFAIQQTLLELAERVIIPDEARVEMLADAEKFSIEEIDVWKNNCKAKSFDFALVNKETEKKIEKKYGFPFTLIPKQKSLWEAK